MYYLKDNKTGQKYRISSKKFLCTRIIPPVSLVIFGLISALILSIIGLSIQLSIALLVIAYFIELGFYFSKRCSVTKLIGAVLMLFLWRDIFYQIFKVNNFKTPFISSNYINELIKTYKSCETSSKTADFYHLNFQ